MAKSKINSKFGVEILSANQARQLLETVQKEKAPSDLKEIMEQIKIRVTDGCNFYVVSGELSPFVESVLDEAGYDINFDDDLSATRIGW